MFWYFGLINKYNLCLYFYENVQNLKIRSKKEQKASIVAKEMLIIIFALVLMIVLTALNFVKLPMRSIIMLSLTVSMVILNFTNELIFHWSDSNPHWRQFENASNIKILKLSDLEKQTKPQSLTFIQKRYLTTLKQNLQTFRPFIIHFQGLKRERLRSVVHKLQTLISLQFLQISFEPNSDKNCFLQSKSLKGVLENGPTFLIVSNLVKQQCFNLIVRYMLDYSVSIILSSVPQDFGAFQRSQIVQKINYNGELQSQLSQKYSLTAVKICNKYHTLDNQFELAFRRSGRTLYDYCVNLRTNRVTQCIREHDKSQQQQIPLTKVKMCLALQTNKNEDLMDSGYYIKGGYLYRRKQYLSSEIRDQDKQYEL